MKYDKKPLPIHFPYFCGILEKFEVFERFKNYDIERPYMFFIVIINRYLELFMSDENTFLLDKAFDRITALVESAISE